MKCSLPVHQIDLIGLTIVLMKKRKQNNFSLIHHNLFVVSIDTKWRSHPPPLATPREEDLYCLGIVKKEKDSSSSIAT